MAMKTQKSSLLAKYGSRLDKAVKEAAGKPPEYGPVRVPGGITNGIARIVECGFGVVQAGKQNAGEVYFRAAGVIVEPESVMVQGRPFTVRGLQTSIMEMVCDTKTSKGKVTTLEEHVERIANELKILGIPEEMLSGGLGSLEEAAEAVKQAAPFFHFSTSQSAPSKEYPDPRVWENWNGIRGLEDYQPEDPTTAVEDDTRTVTPVQVSNGRATAHSPGTAKTLPAVAPKSVPVKKPVSQPEPNPESQPEFSEFEDLDSLATRADTGETAAQEQIKGLATEAGVFAEVDGASTWAEAVEFLKADSGDGSGDDDQATNGEPVPKAGQVVDYRPLNLKTKKREKAVNCDIVGVDVDARTVNLKNLVNPKTRYDNVPWDELADPSN